MNFSFLYDAVKDDKQNKQNNLLDRRTFVKVSTIAGVGMTVGVMPRITDASASLEHGFGHFIRVANDNTVTVIIKHLDKGQGVTTGLTAIVAEELDADWQQMRWEFAPHDPTRYNNLHWGPYQGTGGSSSIANSWMQLRQAGAAAKYLFIQAAAQKWNVDASEITINKGLVSHASGKTGNFSEFIELAAAIAPPQEPTLKKPSQFRLLGTDQIPRIDSPEKTTGAANYTLDVDLPGIKSAVMVHPPVFGGKVKSVDAKAAMRIDGVRKIFSTARGVAIVADSYWLANQARSALKVRWDNSKAETRSSEKLWQDFKSLAKKDAPALRDDGNAEATLKLASQTVELDFEFPYLAHASMEPLNCVAKVNDKRCDIWTASQTPGIDEAVASKLTGLAAENIFIHTQLAGGSFGRRAVPDADFVSDAILIAKELPNIPIKLQWSREDDMKGGRYRPMSYHKMKAAINSNGDIIAWHHRIVSQSLLRGTPFEGLIKGPIDAAITEGAASLPYTIPNFRVDGHEAQVGVPVLWWRSVGHTHNAYATEVFFDELAHKLDKDPIELRLRLLKGQNRYSNVLKLAKEKSNWGSTLPDNKAQGVALHKSFNTYVAQVADVTLNADKSFTVDKVTCTVDCGFAVTPDIVKAQMEGGIAQGLGAILNEKITLKDGKVEQNNFYDYFPLRINQMPDIEVHIVNSDEAPTGVGEPGLPPIGPAVANALRKFRNKPIDELPIGNKV